MRNIYLIGMPGAGKTSIGRLLAKEIQRRFVDTDRLISKKAGQSVQEIFQGKGEAAFRQLEHEVLLDLAKRRNRVVATGGGIILNEDNIRLMQKSGRVIWLKRPPEVIIQNPRIKKRPLLAAEPNRIFTLYQEREALYQKASQIEIENLENKEETVQAILSALEYRRRA